MRKSIRSALQFESSNLIKIYTVIQCYCTRAKYVWNVQRACYDNRMKATLENCLNELSRHKTTLKVKLDCRLTSLE